MSIRVLYIDAVGPFGGASRSLFEAVQALTTNGHVDAFFVMQRGSAQEFYGRIAKGLIATRGLTRFDNTRYSHYRGLRWLVLLREIAYLPFTLLAMFGARRKWQHVDLIHVNEVIDIIPGLLAKALFKAPMVVHVRSLQRMTANSRRTTWIVSRLRRSAAAVVAINENTRASLPSDLRVEIVQNSFTPKKAAQADTQFEQRLAALRPHSLRVGFVGNLHASKGLFDLLEAARLLRKRDVDVEFLIVGGVTLPDRGLKAWLLARAGLAQNVEAQLHARVQAYGLQDSFHLLGHTDDIQSVYERMHVIAFPSHYDAPGRPVFEAAFSGVPSIVCVEEPRSDTLVPWETGLAVPAKDPESLATAIMHFARDRGEVLRMGTNAQLLAEQNFVPAVNAARLLAVYERAIGRSSPLPTPAIG
jgi:glycosyltransferase involved in cell wall biosynthesis